MKLTLEVYGNAERLAEQCHGDECPVGGLGTPIACPFDKLCDEITPEDWKKIGGEG